MTISRELVRVVMSLSVLAVAHSATAHGAAPSTPISIHDCWIRRMPANLPSAAYFRVMNTGSAPVALTAVSTAAYAHTMLHATSTAQGMSHMQHVQHVTVAAQNHVDFAPGGYHVMLVQATRKIAVGETLPMQFVFSSGAAVNGQCAVRAANAATQHSPQHHHQHHQH